MENFSLATAKATRFGESYTNRFEQVEWISAEVINVLAAIFVIWINLSLIVYLKKTEKCRTVNRHKSLKVDAGAAYIFALIAAFCSFLRLASSQIVFNLGYTETSSSCEVSVDISGALYALTILGTYTFLWLRQRSLYQHPEMEAFRKSWLLGLSWLSLVLIVSGVALSLLAMTIPETSVDSGYGCVRKPNNFVSWPYFIIIAFATTSQATMLFLLFYPLLSHVTTNSAYRRVMKIMKRSAIFAVICVLSDVFAMLSVVFAVSDNVLREVTITVYDINMVINVASVFFSFESWRKIFMSPCNVRLIGKTRVQALKTAEAMDVLTDNV